MKIVEYGIGHERKIACECGNDQLVFVQTLYFYDWFIILCPKCGQRAKIKVDRTTLKDMSKETNGK